MEHGLLGSEELLMEIILLILILSSLSQSRTTYSGTYGGRSLSDEDLRRLREVEQSARDRRSKMARAELEMSRRSLDLGRLRRAKQYSYHSRVELPPRPILGE